MKETLKALREKFNYSQNSVAQFLGVSRQMYIKYESGEVEPPVKVVVSLAGLYKVPYDILIDNKMVNHGEEIADSMLETKREKDPLEDIWARAEKSKTGSNGWKWNREELYDREICKHRGE